MHYRHSYHAGNFADVFKHVVLCGLLAALNRKDKPWCYLETHAGAGTYDLESEGAAKTGEWRDGIGALIPGEDDLPEPLNTCVRIVKEINGGAALRTYPGSPYFARAFARSGDRLVLCEKTPEVAAALRGYFPKDSRIVIHQRDGYESHSLLPPAEKRGLVLVDPPFERPDEFEAVAEFLKKALSRFSGGVYAAWYPIKNRHVTGRFERRVARESGKPALALRFENGAPGEGQMRACGMMIANPPFQFERDIELALKVLVRELTQGAHAAYQIETLQPDAT